MADFLRLGEDAGVDSIVTQRDASLERGAQHHLHARPRGLLDLQHGLEPADDGGLDHERAEVSVAEEGPPDVLLEALVQRVLHPSPPAELGELGRVLERFFDVFDGLRALGPDSLHELHRLLQRPTLVAIKAEPLASLAYHLRQPPDQHSLLTHVLDTADLDLEHRMLCRDRVGPRLGGAEFRARDQAVEVDVRLDAAVLRLGQHHCDRLANRLRDRLQDSHLEGGADAVRHLVALELHAHLRHVEVPLGELFDVRGGVEKPARKAAVQTRHLLGHDPTPQSLSCVLEDLFDVSEGLLVEAWQRCALAEPHVTPHRAQLDCEPCPLRQRLTCAQLERASKRH
mmetsp:Transcript_6402/g.14908  ORF Transcript_6402/g.14908 Transcript_6402/m.14908 type:complete len:342 (-) Transcript_6402:2767-3792(-)